MSSSYQEFKDEIASKDVITSVVKQYENAAYSKFVESSKNSEFYDGYLHYSLFSLIDPFLRAEGDLRKRVLDIGCGNAILGRKIKRICPDVYVLGVDLSDAMLSEAKRHVQIDNVSSGFEFLNSDISQIPDYVGSFDCIISGFVLAHLTTKDSIFGYFRQVYNHLLSGGLTAHIIPAGGFDGIEEGTALKASLPYEDDDGTEKFIELFDFQWTSETYRAAAVESGLVDVVIEPGKIAPGSGITEPLPIHITILHARKP